MWSVLEGNGEAPSEPPPGLLDRDRRYFPECFDVLRRRAFLVVLVVSLSVLVSGVFVARRFGIDVSALLRLSSASTGHVSRSVGVAMIHYRLPL